MLTQDMIHHITSVCNGCQSHDDCEIARGFAVLDRCENFKSKEMPLIRNSWQSSVFVFPSTSLYVSISREIPEERLQWKKSHGNGGKIS
jgi:hypothetical protein